MESQQNNCEEMSPTSPLIMYANMSIDSLVNAFIASRLYFHQLNTKFTQLCTNKEETLHQLKKLNEDKISLEAQNRDLYNQIELFQRELQTSREVIQTLESTYANRFQRDYEELKPFDIQHENEIDKLESGSVRIVDKTVGHWVSDTVSLTPGSQSTILVQIESGDVYPLTIRNRTDQLVKLNAGFPLGFYIQKRLIEAVY